ncbi:MAG: METTL5 family protein [Methanomassiliicoccaceae archaeon]|jgi:putative methylase|nr:METTL5 family protein [Methanomassiliicoccaceae archaeon]
MKKKDLEIRLQKVKNFNDPDASLEQYMTPAVIASDVLFTAYSEGDIHNMDVLDLGCGTGMFSIGAWMLGAKSVKGFDISEKAIAVAEDNVGAFGADVELNIRDIKDVDEKADTALMNPPFGAQNRRADRPFLDKAMILCDSVYSMHIGTTIDFLNEYVRSAGREICFQRNYRFNIPHTFPFHNKERHNVDIIMIMIR